MITDWGDDDLMLCQITSKDKFDGMEVSLMAANFVNGNLPVNSDIRPNKIFTVSKSDIICSVGKISKKKYQEVISKLIVLVS